MPVQRMLEPLIDLRARVEKYAVPYRRYLAVNLCLACQGKMATWQVPESVDLLKQVMGFTVHTVEEAQQCLLCCARRA